jgi:hypothetical protein
MNMREGAHTTPPPTVVTSAAIMTFTGKRLRSVFRTAPGFARSMEGEGV